MNNLYDYEKRYTEILKMPRTPSWNVPKDGIYDENQSVKWNRTKTLEESERWQKEKEDLIKAFETSKKEWEHELITFISEEVSCTYKAAEKIWRIADWDYNRCECLMDYYYEIREADNFS